MSSKTTIKDMPEDEKLERLCDGVHRKLSLQVFEHLIKVHGRHPTIKEFDEFFCYILANHNFKSEFTDDGKCFLIWEKKG